MTLFHLSAARVSECCNHNAQGKQTKGGDRRTELLIAHPCEFSQQWLFLVRTMLQTILFEALRTFEVDEFSRSALAFPTGEVYCGMPLPVRFQEQPLI